MSIINCLPADRPAVVQPLVVTQNGTFTPGAGVDGFSPVTVNVNCEPTFVGNFSAVNGTSLVRGHIVKGFSSSAGFFFPRTPADTVPSYDMTKPFHIRMTVSCSELMSREQVVIGDTASEYARPVIAFGAQSGGYPLISGYFSTTGSSWDATLSVSKLEMPFVADKWYTVDYTWDDGVFTFSVSDGVNTVTKTAATAHFTTAADGGASRVELGARKGQLFAQYGSVDLLDTYWEENGTLLWGNRS